MYTLITAAKNHKTPSILERKKKRYPWLSSLSSASREKGSHIEISEQTIIQIVKK